MIKSPSTKTNDSSQYTNFKSKPTSEEAKSAPLPTLCTTDLISAYLEEDNAVNQRAKQSERRQASGAAARYEKQLLKKHKDNPDFTIWAPLRSLARQDFDYLFYHRYKLQESTRELLEIIASKISYTRDGKDGYFNRLEQNVPWTPHITPIVFSRSQSRENLVRCGLWPNAKNSRRCHNTDLCPLCSWLDHLQVLVEGFGTKSHAFSRAQGWFFITCSYTSREENSNFVGRDLEAEELITMGRNNDYDPYPVEIGNKYGDNEIEGCTDARLLGLIIQKALDRLYKSRIVEGYRNKLEGAFFVHPWHGTRLNMHAHAIANGKEINPQFIAEELYKSMTNELTKPEQPLGLYGSYYPDVLVLRINSPEALQRCLCYSEKILPIKGIFAQAMDQEDARDAQGQFNADYVGDLENALFRLIDEYIENIFTGFSCDSMVPGLHRRKTVGNMRFSDKGYCVGDEPAWHKRWRRKKSAQQKKRRRAKRKEKTTVMGTEEASRPNLVNEKSSQAESSYEDQ